MADSRLGQGVHKISLEHLVVPESKKILNTHNNDGGGHRDTELPMAKSAAIRAAMKECSNRV